MGFINVVNNIPHLSARERLRDDEPLEFVWKPVVRQMQNSIALMKDFGSKISNGEQTVLNIFASNLSTLRNCVLVEMHCGFVGFAEDV